MRESMQRDKARPGRARSSVASFASERASTLTSRAGCPVDLANSPRVTMQRQAMPSPPSGGGSPAGVSAPGGAGGLPGSLVTGIASLSGMDLSDVRVHRGSPKPEAVGALAFAQGGEIHLGPGQEGHLPHEAWHIVQQRQGRVKATRQDKGIDVNDDVGLEQEATVMGERAMRAGATAAGSPSDPRSSAGGAMVRSAASISRGPLQMLAKVQKGNVGALSAEHIKEVFKFLQGKVEGGITISMEESEILRIHFFNDATKAAVKAATSPTPEQEEMIKGLWTAKAIKDGGLRSFSPEVFSWQRLTAYFRIKRANKWDQKAQQGWTGVNALTQPPPPPPSPASSSPPSPPPPQPSRPIDIKDPENEHGNVQQNPVHKTTIKAIRGENRGAVIQEGIPEVSKPERVLAPVGAGVGVVGVGFGLTDVGYNIDGAEMAEGISDAFNYALGGGGAIFALKSFKELIQEYRDDPEQVDKLLAALDGASAASDTAESICGIIEAADAMDSAAPIFAVISGPIQMVMSGYTLYQGRGAVGQMEEKVRTKNQSIGTERTRLETERTRISTEHTDLNTKKTELTDEATSLRTATTGKTETGQLDAALKTRVEKYDDDLKAFKSRALKLNADIKKFTDDVKALVKLENSRDAHTAVKDSAETKRNLAGLGLATGAAKTAGGFVLLATAFTPVGWALMAMAIAGGVAAIAYKTLKQKSVQRETVNRLLDVEGEFRAKQGRGYTGSKKAVRKELLLKHGYMSKADFYLEYIHIQATYLHTLLNNALTGTSPRTDPEVVSAVEAVTKLRLTVDFGKSVIPSVSKIADKLK